MPLPTLPGTSGQGAPGVPGRDEPWTSPPAPPVCPPSKCYRPQNAARAALLGGLSVDVAFSLQASTAVYSTFSTSVALTHQTRVFITNSESCVPRP